MIEIIYKGEEKEENASTVIKLPKNVRQIGECEHDNKKIYVEDFVMTYVKHFSTRNLKYGVLLGNIRRGNGNTYVFVTGAVCAQPLIDNDIIFDDDVWTRIYEDVKTYFEDVEIVGWFSSMPSILNNDMPNIQKVHLDNFAGNDKVCFLLDRLECEESFYLYDDGGMKKCNGHYIYYEKNADMQSYMALHAEINESDDEYEQTSRKKGIHAKVHQLFFEPSENREVLKRKTPDYSLAEYIGINKEEKKTESPEEVQPKRTRLPSFAYSASSFMLIAILIGTIAMMNASGQLKQLKSAVAGIGSKETTTGASKSTEDDATAKIIDVVGNVEPTTVPQATEPVNQTQPSQQSTEAPTQAPTQAPTEAPTPAPQPVVTPIQPEPKYYIVKPGDSLYSISLKNYGNVTMVNEIIKANNLTNENFIKEGETILLP